MLDLILKNGVLQDPKNGLAGKIGDIGIRNGKIVQLGRVEEEAVHVIELDGLTVTPGLIDFHAHFFSGGTNTSLEFYRYLADGVTNAVDAGSAGASNIESFFQSLSEKEKRNTRFYLNLASEGLSCLGAHPENVNPAFFQEEKIMELCDRYAGRIIGLKLRISEEVTKECGTTSFAALRRGVEIANRCGLPLSVHMPNFQGELKELIDILRPGDIFCHVFTPQKGILEEGEPLTVSSEMIRAMEKGIVLEAACGKGHFGHTCALAAFQKGILPDIISGDFTQNTHHYEPAYSLPYLMSRFMALGMSFEEVLSGCTSAPAQKMGMEQEIGCLRIGARANIAVFEREKGTFSFMDVRGVSVTGQEMLVPKMTIYEGDCVYRNRI